MDLEIFKEKVTIDGDYKKFPLELGSLSWNWKLFAHDIHSVNLCKKDERAKCAKRNYGFSYTVFVDMEVPPTAFFQAAFDSLLGGCTIPLKIGIARCNPMDQFCKKTGREIAEKNAHVYQIEVIDINRNPEKGRISVSFKIADIPENGTRVPRTVYKLVVNNSGRVYLELNE